MMLVNMAHTMANMVGSMMVMVVLAPIDDFPDHDDSGFHLGRVIFVLTSIFSSYMLM
jgi:hypothetical protein